MSILYKKLIEKLLEELKIRALRHYGDNLVSLLIFGSVAKGLNTSESDIDLLVVLKTAPKNNYERYEEFFDIVDELGTMEEIKQRGYNALINPIIKLADTLRPDSTWLLDNNFIIIYDREGFFSEFRHRIEEARDKLKFTDIPMPHYIEV